MIDSVQSVGKAQATDQLPSPVFEASSDQGFAPISGQIEINCGSGLARECGASFNINLKYVRQVSREYAMFDNGDTVRIPYRSYPSIMECFLKFQMDT